jgi:hypothetical protein
MRVPPDESEVRGGPKGPGLIRMFRRGCVLLAILLGSSQVSVGPAAAQAGTAPQLYTHQSYAEDATRASKLAIDDPMAVFAFVLGSLPDRVKVYPTENYYYFYFIHRHIRYAGNIRLDVTDRDQGKVHFAYYQDLSEWTYYDEGSISHAVLDGAKSVAVEKLAPLVYRVSHGGKSVTFELNDLSSVRPPPGAFGPDEVFLGPIFDESAIRFFLVFNRKLKLFHYVLDETIEVADQFVRADATDRILIGKRTGFAYYRDHKLDRKILIGVFEANSRVNNYFDGPFDQLPDNFIEGEALRDAILAVEPKLAGKIDRFGISPGGADRYMIGPYRHYRSEDELLVFHNCATDKRVPAARYYECFVFNEESGTVAADSRSPAGKLRRNAGRKPR